MRKVLALPVLALLAGWAVVGCSSDSSSGTPNGTTTGATTGGATNGGATTGGSATGGTTGATGTATVLGRVQMPTTGALPALTAQVMGTGVSTAVQSDGTFTLNNVPAGPQTVVVMDPSQAQVDVAGVQVGTGSLSLHPFPPPGGISLAGNTGIAGTVYRGPIFPVDRPGQVNDAPFATALNVLNANGAVVATVNSDSDGNFSLPLAPGTYTLVGANSTNVFPHSAPVQVTLSQNYVTYILVSFDTGIR